MIDHILGSDNYQLSLKLLDAAALRHQAIATNLANAETPGFKRIDLAPTFEQQLADHMRNPSNGSIDSIRPTLAQDPTARSEREDGNNVEIDRELLEMNRNALEYQFLTQYASDSIKRLKTAITGRVS
ncbi:MAG: flagellar basal body rod protein FlgB [Verrucomicrobia bacterium]|nr:MAG: flagellar basal body rod protein FlgB [Verrucomicrobiota bacterium]